MKTETYNCNLCGDERDREDLYAMHSQSGQVYQFLSFNHPQWTQTYRHVCKSCVSQIKEKCK